MDIGPEQVLRLQQDGQTLSDHSPARGLLLTLKSSGLIAGDAEKGKQM